KRCDRLRLLDHERRRLIRLDETKLNLIHLGDSLKWRPPFPGPLIAKRAADCQFLRLCHIVFARMTIPSGDTKWPELPPRSSPATGRSNPPAPPCCWWMYRTRSTTTSKRRFVPSSTPLRAK